MNSIKTIDVLSPGMVSGVPRGPGQSPLLEGVPGSTHAQAKPSRAVVYLGDEDRRLVPCGSPMLLNVRLS
jgi:hypothetical protein